MGRWANIYLNNCKSITIKPQTIIGYGQMEKYGDWGLGNGSALPMGKRGCQMKKFVKKYYVIISLMLVYFAVNFDKGLIGMAIIPIRERFGLSATQAGFMMSAYSLGYAVVSLPGGWIADKLGYKRVLIACLTLATICTIIFPFASVLVLFITIRFLMGFSQGSVPSATTKGIALNYEKEKRVMIQSVWFVSQNIAGFAATYIGARIIAINYQYAYWTAAILYVIVLLLIWKTLPNIKAVEKTEKDKTRVKVSDVFKDRNMWIFAICIFVFNLILNGSNNWYATFLSTHFNRDMVDIGNILSLSSLISIGCSPITGIMLSKVFKGRENWFIFFSTIITGILYIVMVKGNVLMVSVLCIYMAAYTSMFPFVAIKTLPQKLISEQYIGTTMGVITAVSSFGGFVAPTMIGAILDAGGGEFENAFFALSALGVCAGTVALFGLKLPKENRKDA